MQEVLFAELKQFSGINTVDRMVRLEMEQTGYYKQDAIYPLSIAKNIDIDNTRGILKRAGTLKVLSASGAHSFWADRDLSYFVEEEHLYQFNAEDYSITEIRRSLPIGVRVSFVRINDVVFYSNGYTIGYIEDGVDHSLPDPGQEYKTRMPPGKFLAYYKGRLLVAEGSTLWFSDAMAFYRRDMRRNFIQFSGEITMVAPVDNGVYVADGKVHFLQGDAPETMTRVGAYDYNAIPYSQTYIEGRYVKDGKDQDGFIIFISERGICIGNSKGSIEDATEHRLKLESYKYGAGTVINDNSRVRYVGSLTT